MKIKFLFILWCTLSAIALAVDQPNAISFLDSSGNQQIYIFAQGINGHLVMNYRDKSGWHWKDQSLPPGASWVDQISATTYSDGVNQFIYVFAETDQGHLVVNYLTADGWLWADQGLPAGVNSLSQNGTNSHNTAAVTYQDASQTQRFDVFAVTDTGRLIRNYWDGSTWQWADQSLPQGSAGVFSISAVTYVDQAQNNRIYVFAETYEGSLAVNYFDGARWHWASQGIPPAFGYVIRPTAVTLTDAAGRQLFYVFAIGLRYVNGAQIEHLVVNYWTGSNWYWADQGMAPSMAPVPPAVTTYGTGASLRMDVFALAGKTAVDDSIYDNYWDGSHWYWKDLGRPSGITQFQNESPTAVTFSEYGLQQIYLFAVDDLDTDLFMDYCNVFGRSWSNRGPQ